MPVVWILFDLKSRESHVFPTQADALAQRDIIIAKSRRARTEIASGGLPPRNESEFFTTQVNI